MSSSSISTWVSISILTYRVLNSLSNQEIVATIPKSSRDDGLRFLLILLTSSTAPRARGITDSSDLTASSRFFWLSCIRAASVQILTALSVCASPSWSSWPIRLLSSSWAVRSLDDNSVSSLPDCFSASSVLLRSPISPAKSTLAFESSLVLLITRSSNSPWAFWSSAPARLRWIASA